jgi:hypothetical protein
MVLRPGYKGQRSSEQQDPRNRNLESKGSGNHQVFRTKDLKT